MASWTNWAGNQTCHPKSVIAPYDELELSRLVRRAESVRVAGASHSFSPLVPTSETIVSLEHFHGLIDVDPAACRAICGAGTTIAEVGEPLWNHGMALSAQGDVDHQTLAGACATGTHGTGAAFGCFSTMLRGFRLLLADGSFLDCDEATNTKVFHAGRIGLGLLGVMTQVTLQCEPAFHLCQQLRPMHREEFWKLAADLSASHRHLEAFAFPYSDRVVVESQDVTQLPARPKKVDLDDVVLWTLSQAARSCPPLNRGLQRVGMRIMPRETTIDRSYRIYPSVRRTRFREVEYALPVDRGMECFEELIALIRQQRIATGFPLECRWVAADDIWLSPFYERPAIVISVHQYWRQDPTQWFQAAEDVLRAHQGRPHWGKLHTLSRLDFEKLYPRWEEFVALRRELDPTGKFLNDYLRELFQ